MNDIAERLHFCARFTASTEPQRLRLLLEESAARIETLEDALREIVKLLEDEPWVHDALEEARAALEKDTER